MVRALFLVVGSCLAVAACNTAHSEPDQSQRAVRTFTEDDRVVGLDPNGQVHDYSNDEIGPAGYDNIARMGHVAQLRPMVKKALQDNIVTVAEYNVIFEANSKMIAQEDAEAEATEHRAMIEAIKADVN